MQPLHREDQLDKKWLNLRAFLALQNFVLACPISCLKGLVHFPFFSIFFMCALYNVSTQFSCSLLRHRVSISQRRAFSEMLLFSSLGAFLEDCSRQHPVH